MTKRQLIVLASALSFLLLSFAGMKFFKYLKKEPAVRPITEIKRAVMVDTISYRTIVSSVNSTGRVITHNEIDLISEVQGKILGGPITLKKGTRFKKGDLLVEIFNLDADFALQSRKSRYLNSLATILPDLKIDYPDSYKSWMNFFSSVEIDKPLPQLPKMVNDNEKIFLASRNVLSEYYGIKSDEVRMDKYRIYAPFSGSVTSVTLETGSVANPGSRIARLINTTDLEVEIPIESDKIDWIGIGDPVIFQNGNISIESKITRKSQFVDPSTQSFSVFAALQPQTGFQVYNGQYLAALFPGKNVPNAMEIPRSAVFNFNEVFLVDSGLLQKHQINLLKVNEKTVLFNGLPENSIVVIEPLANAKENSAVEIRN